MTQSTPPDPQPRNERQDEIIAVVLAIATAGGILFWGMTRTGDRFSIADIGSETNIISAASPSADADTDLEAGAEPDTPLLNRDEDTLTDPNPLGEESEDMTNGISSFFNSIMSGGGIPAFSPSSSNEATTQGQEGVSPTDRSSNSQTSDQPEQSDQTVGINPSENASSTAENTDDAAELPASESSASVTDSAEDGSVSDAPEPSETEPSDDSANLPAPTDFTDVDSDYWAKPYIDRMSQLGIVAGFPEGEFRPNTEVNRAEFASSLRRAFANDTDTSDTTETSTYNDVTADYWAQDAIVKATQLGFMTGYPDETFKPTSAIPRLEAVIALATGLDLSIPDNPDAILQVYDDRDQIPAWAVDKVAAATAAGLVINHPNVNQFAPSEITTRAEAISMIYLAIARQRNLSEISSEYRVMP